MKTFLIAGKIWEVRLTSEQYGLFDPLLAGYDDWNTIINNLSNIQINTPDLQKVGMLMLGLIETIVNDGNMIKLLSYILVECTEEEFHIEQALANEILLAKIDFVQVINVFAEFFQLYVAMYTLQQINQTN